MAHSFEREKRIKVNYDQGSERKGLKG